MNLLHQLFGWLRGTAVSPNPPTPNFDGAIKLLRQLQKQKEAFVHPLEIGGVETYLAGFRAGCAAFGAELPPKLRASVLERRGWKRSAAGPVPQMKEKGMTDLAVMDELIEIEIELWQRFAELRAAPAKPGK
jgi:hypothetical protein